MSSLWIDAAMNFLNYYERPSIRGKELQYNKVLTDRAKKKLVSTERLQVSKASRTYLLCENGLKRHGDYQVLLNSLVYLSIDNELTGGTHTQQTFCSEFEASNFRRLLTTTCTQVHGFFPVLKMTTKFS
jgi:hypothetical protein